jgi:hypothetical protein
MYLISKDQIDLDKNFAMMQVKSSLFSSLVELKNFLAVLGGFKPGALHPVPPATIWALPCPCLFAAEKSKP